MLREVSAAYELKGGNIFQIRAYDTAADVIEHSTSEIKDLWEEGQLDQIPGIGESLQAHLDELFKTGKVKHWEELKKGIPEVVFELLDIPGIGPKTALKISKLGVKNIDELKKGIEDQSLLKKGLSPKMAKKILFGISQLPAIKSGRMLLPYAYSQAEKILDYLKKNPKVVKADALGSLRRMVATIGDLDFAVASKDPGEVIDYIVSMPGVSQVLGKGETKVTIALFSGLQLDFRIVDPSSYGAVLQYFTGSKQHNIHLREIAEGQGLSLSEYGVKDIKTGKVHMTPTEKEFYLLLGMEVPPPEIREDTGEIEASLKHKLPQLVELKDIKGDLHLHSNFPIEPSHDLGVDDIREIVAQAKRLGYSYIGIADHQPSVGNHTKEQMIELIKKRSKLIEQINYSQKNIRVLNLLEVDISPDGSLSVPDEGLKLLDFAIAGVHSAHRQSKEQMTQRILQALKNPYIKVLTHPTGRILNERESYDVEWPKIFQYAAENNKALEINAWPNRLDLPDNLARDAKSFGIKFVIDTDSHEKSQMEFIRFGVAVARRGWVTKDDVLNTWEWTRFAKWFNIRM